MPEGNEIEGPLGIWPWPILNTIIRVAEARGSQGVDIESLEPVFDDSGNVEEIRVNKSTDEQSDE